MRMLDLFCGRLGWSKAFAQRGWKCLGIDLVVPPEIPDNCEFWQNDILNVSVKNGWFYVIRRPEAPNTWRDWKRHVTAGRPGWEKTRTMLKCSHFDFICASPPCEQFSVHGMKHFHPNPPYPALGIKLFEHTRRICEESGVPYVIENVRPAQQFVGNAVHHCGPFYLWGTGVPPIVHRGIGKGTLWGRPREYRRQHDPRYKTSSRGKKRDELTAQFATIPPELANCVADYAERLLEQRKVVFSGA